MKNIKFLFLILAVAVVSVSCETYDDYETPRDTVVGFTLSTKNINRIPEGGTKSETVTVFASDVSSAARTYNVVVVPILDPEINVPTAPENYTFDSTVTIPANERIGEITVTGIDVTVSDERTYFQLAIEGGSDVVSGGEILIGLKN